MLNRWGRVIWISLISLILLSSGAWPEKKIATINLFHHQNKIQATHHFDQSTVETSKMTTHEINLSNTPAAAQNVVSYHEFF